METAQSVINDALQEILVQANEAPIQAVDFATAARYMNRMMAALSSRGISLGYTTVTKASDPITIPDGAIEGLIFNLALRLATSYDMPVTESLALSARDGLKAMRRIAISNRPSIMPCTMPIGSGNEYDSSYNNCHFYPCPSDEMLTEEGGAILLESETND